MNIWNIYRYVDEIIVEESDIFGLNSLNYDLSAYKITCRVYHAQYIYVVTCSQHKYIIWISIFNIL